MRRIFIGSVAIASVLAATSVFAADLPARTYTKAPVMVDPGFNWSGFYVGGNVGYSWGRSGNTETLSVLATGGALFTNTSRNDVNGVIGGATGLAGIVAVIWCSTRGWPPAEQRAVFQPSGVAVFLMTGVWLGGTGMIGADTLSLFLIGLPVLALGTWAGLKLFGRLDDNAFRRIVLALLLLSGLSLLVLGR
jgi:uncharacterized membrane protein YfcA